MKKSKMKRRWVQPPRGGGTPHMKGVRMLVGNFELTPKGRRSGRGPSFVWPLKEIMLIHRQYIYFYIFSRTTLNETFTAKYDGVLPRTLSVRRKSEIYTPKGDDEHPHPFHTRSAPPPPVQPLTSVFSASQRGAVDLSIRDRSWDHVYVSFSSHIAVIVEGLAFSL